MIVLGISMLESPLTATTGVLGLYLLLSQKIVLGTNSLESTTTATTSLLGHTHIGLPWGWGSSRSPATSLPRPQAPPGV